MTDPTIGVGEAAARAPRLEHADVLLIERELDELERRCADVNDPQPLMTRLWAGKAIQQLRAARAPREPLEPVIQQMRALVDDPSHWMEVGPSRSQVEKWVEALAAGRSALPPPPTVSVTVSEIRDGEENDGPLLSTDLFIEGRGMSALVNATIHGEVTFVVSVDGVRLKSGTLRAALPRAPEPDLEPPDLFREGWSAGFQEALQPDRYPDRDRCLDAWREVRAARAGAEAPPPERKV
jgi:hypothetical protein